MFRYRRRQLCEYLSTLIRACANKDNTEETCDKAVLGAIQFHRKSKQKNNRVCLMGKYHNVLYVAARIAFKFNLKNTATIQQLLQEIFDCEQTFERLMSGESWVLGISVWYYSFWCQVFLLKAWQKMFFDSIIGLKNRTILLLGYLSEIYPKEVIYCTNYWIQVCCFYNI